MGFAPNMYNDMLSNIQHSQLQLSFSMAISPTSVFHPDLAVERESEIIYDPIICGDGDQFIGTECGHLDGLTPASLSTPRCRKS